MKLYNTTQKTMANTADSGKVKNLEDWAVNFVDNVKNGETLIEYPREFIWKNKASFILGDNGKPALKANGEVIQPVDKALSKIAFRNYVGSLQAFKPYFDKDMFNADGNFQMASMDLMSKNIITKKVRSLGTSVDKYFNALSKAAGEKPAKKGDAVNVAWLTKVSNGGYGLLGRYAQGVFVYNVKANKFEEKAGAVQGSKPATAKGELTKLKNIANNLDALSKNKKNKAEMQALKDKYIAELGRISVVINSL